MQPSEAHNVDVQPFELRSRNAEPHMDCSSLHAHGYVLFLLYQSMHTDPTNQHPRNKASMLVFTRKR
eukprot:scaffold25563_cov14-Tisochrysis_lutea.AAC.1